MKTVLFLCSGNYYRSRFAELFFNHQAPRRHLPWRAQSRGFFIHGGNVGPISEHALHGLQTRGVAVDSQIRFPLVLTEEDLETAHHVVALKEAEHRPKMDANFPRWTQRVEFWTIDDIDCARPEAALVHLEQALLELMTRLAALAGNHGITHGSGR